MTSRRCRTIGAIVVASVAASSAALAGVGRWTASGPPGGVVRKLAAAPNSPILYVATGRNGVFRSNDGGARWTSAGLVGFPLTYLAVAPAMPSVVYAIDRVDNVYKSVNFGGDWSLVPGPFPFVSVDAITVDPTNSMIVYASGAGVRKSIDGGSTWAPAAGGCDSGFGPLAIDPQTSTTIYAASGCGVLKSLDGGQKWTNVSSKEYLLNRFVTDVEISPANPLTVYATTTSYPGFHRSLDGGATWTETPVWGPAAFAVDRFEPSRIYLASGAAEVYVSVDGGQTFAATSLMGTVFDVLVTGAGTAFLATGDGVWKTTNGGSDWAKLPRGPTDFAVLAVAIDAGSPFEVYVATDFPGVHKSGDNGLTWSLPVTFGSHVRTVVTHPTQSKVAYAATEFTGIFKTTDGGAKWLPANQGLPSPDVWSIAIDPLSPGTVYAIAGFRVYKSANGGATWAPAGTGLGDSVILSLAVRGQLIFAGSNGGVFRSTDGAASWHPPVPGLPQEVRTITIDPQQPSTVYASTNGGGVFQSLDSGESWIPRNVGLEKGQLYALVIDPADPSTLYAGASFSPSLGMFRSTDRGASWTPFRDGLTNLSVSSLAIDATGTVLYAGTLGGGVFGYRSPRSSFYTIAPCRLVDTRDPQGPFGGPSLGADAERTFVLAGRCGIPQFAKSLAVNITVTGGTAPGHLVLFPAEYPEPQASSINWSMGRTRANNAVLTLGPRGDVSIRSASSGPVEVIIDVTGYFE